MAVVCRVVVVVVVVVVVDHFHLPAARVAFKIKTLRC